MRNLAWLVAGCLTFSIAVRAHEFWIEPTMMQPARDAELHVQVRVGEHFDGDVFPFQPRAYQAAYWVGPASVQALHTQPLGQDNLTLTAQGDGLHVLAVASFGSRLIHDNLQDFEAFAAEIGASAVLAGTPPHAERDGTLHETYRRFSKTLVHFGARTGADRRLGLEYEWVQSRSGFTLFTPQGPVPHHPVDVFCRQSDQQVRQQRLHTNADGQVTPDTANGDRCLINAVFLKAPTSSRRWTSDWVSMLWDD
ncbi:MAG: DUF4198 domain-containing protein [Pseudomonadota bacterium]